MTIFDMLQEMESFTKVSEDDLNKASHSNINEKNSIHLKRLIEEWCDGCYDEDPDLLVNNLVYLLN